MGSGFSPGPAPLPGLPGMAPPSTRSSGAEQLPHLPPIKSRSFSTLSSSWSSQPLRVLTALLRFPSSADHDQSLMSCPASTAVQTAHPLWHNWPQHSPTGSWLKLPTAYRKGPSSYHGLCSSAQLGAQTPPLLRLLSSCPGSILFGHSSIFCPYEVSAPSIFRALTCVTPRT